MKTKIGKKNKRRKKENEQEIVLLRERVKERTQRGRRTGAESCKRRGGGSGRERLKKE